MEVTVILTIKLYGDDIAVKIHATFPTKFVRVDEGPQDNINFPKIGKV